MTLRIDITSDFVCPWCHVGTARLFRALERSPGIEARLRWLPFELNPDMPPEGTERRAYRIAKFGSWERSQELDARVAAAGAEDGLVFDYGRQTRTPNTFLAHRLAWWAEARGRQRETVLALYRAYFSEGRDIGRPEVLAGIATGAGLDGQEAASFLAGDEGTQEVRMLEARARQAGIGGVPLFEIGGLVLEGAHPVPLFVEALRRASELAA